MEKVAANKDDEDVDDGHEIDIQFPIPDFTTVDVKPGQCHSTNDRRYT